MQNWEEKKLLSHQVFKLTVDNAFFQCETCYSKPKSNKELTIPNWTLHSFVLIKEGFRVSIGMDHLGDNVIFVGTRLKNIKCMNTLKQNIMVKLRRKDLCGRKLQDGDLFRNPYLNYPYLMNIFEGKVSCIDHICFMGYGLWAMGLVYGNS